MQQKSSLPLCEGPMWTSRVTVFSGGTARALAVGAALGRSPSCANPSSAVPILTVPCPSWQCRAPPGNAHPGSAVPIPAVPCPSWQRHVQGAPRGHRAGSSAPRHSPAAPGAAAPPRAGKIQQLFQITLLSKINKGLLSSIAGLMIVGHHLREWRC